MTPNSVSSLLRSSTWQILPISGKKKTYPTAATASAMLPNFECLLSSSCGRAAARTKPGSQISAPHSANYRLQFPFLAQEREVERCLNVVFFTILCAFQTGPTQPFPSSILKTNLQHFLPLIFHTLLFSKNKMMKWTQRLLLTFSSPVDAQQFGSWNSISSSSEGGTAMGKISCMALSSTRPCSMPLATKTPKARNETLTFKHHVT